MRQVTSVTMFEPEICGQTALFRWRTEPPTPAYTRECFELRFPDGVDLGRVPRALWWQVMFTCLHAHWIPLRPCVVKLPVSLPPGERDLWLRILDATVDTQEAHRNAGVGSFERLVDIEEGAGVVQPLPARSGTDEVVAAFSGGKDSLTMAAMLAEIGQRPVLVAVKSPMPPMRDHEVPYRRWMLEEVRRRGGFEVVEVESDLRASWVNEYPFSLGLPSTMNELSDVYLYYVTALVVAVARGAGQVAIAAQSDNHEATLIDGRITLYHMVMSAAPVLRAIAELSAPLGVTLTLPLAPVHYGQILELLYRRYPRLRDLQFSCFSQVGDQRACGVCVKCRRTALPYVTFGGRASGLGVDIVELYLALRRFKAEPGGLLPREYHRAWLARQVMSATRAMPPRVAAWRLVREDPGALFSRRGRDALRAYRAAFQIATAEGVEREGCFEGLLRYVSEPQREPIRSMLAAEFGFAEPGRYGDSFGCSMSLRNG